jgi:hypothetical protein
VMFCDLLKRHRGRAYRCQPFLTENSNPPSNGSVIVENPFLGSVK